ncbi:MAG: Holliday junction resolvase RuvX [Chitinophagales bacterium]|nr:Holliday junction resolvase RuvX [Chitinophagales bacterium]
MRIIGIDYGKKRCGLSVTDNLQIIATHLVSVASNDLLSYLKGYCEKEVVEGFVIGKPLKLNNQLNEIAKDIVELKIKLNQCFPDKYIEEIDERFTSKIAFQSILDSGVGKEKRKNKANIDVVAAVIILQNYLDLKSNLNK